MKCGAILMSGGSGCRYGSKVPKQYLGSPSMTYTVVDKFISSRLFACIIVIIRECDSELYYESIDGLNFEGKVFFADSTRFSSVKKVLNKLKYMCMDFIMIHDVARPFVDIALIHSIMKTAQLSEEVSGVIPVCRSSDSVCLIDENDYIRSNIVRSELRMIQTPQCFRFSDILKSFNIMDEGNNRFTDESSVLFECGFCIKTIPGDLNNTKITYPKDWLMDQNLKSS